MLSYQAKQVRNVTVVVALALALGLLLATAKGNEIDAEAAFAFAKAKHTVIAKDSVCDCDGPWNCDCDNCTCPNCADPAWKKYESLAAKSVKENKGLVVWVGYQNPEIVRANPDVYHIQVKRFPGVKDKGVVLAKADGQGWLYRDDYPTISSEQIRKHFAPAITIPTARQGGPTWTWPGDLSQHLQAAHNIDTSGMTFEQMRNVHDNLHNAELIPAAQAAFPVAPQMFAANCPT